MAYRLADDVRPQAALLAVAVVVSVGLWLVSWAVPFVSLLVYPLQLFATFVHEGGHVLASVVTGGDVLSLTVAPDTSGAVRSAFTEGSRFDRIVVSSAGYLGTTLYAVLLLVWFRHRWSSRGALHLSAAVIAVLTVGFGLIAPIANLGSAGVTLGGAVFTVVAGAVLAGVLFVVARAAPGRWADFALAFLAVQCLLNALFSLRDLFIVSTFTVAHSDAGNLAALTGVPAVLWVVLWTLLSGLVIAAGLRSYVDRRGRDGSTGSTLRLDDAA